MHRGAKINNVREHIESEDEGDDPFKNGGDVAMFGEVRGCENNGENKFDEDKSQLDPEGRAKDTMLAVFDSKPLILPAREHGREDVTAYEQQEEAVVHPRMVSDVKNGQQDQARCSGDGPDDAQPNEGLFPRRLVGYQPAAVTQPSLGEEGQVKRDDGDAGARDEEGLEIAGANVADVCDGGIRVHPGVVPVVGVDDPVEEHAEEHA